MTDYSMANWKLLILSAEDKYMLLLSTYLLDFFLYLNSPARCSLPCLPYVFFIFAQEVGP